MAARHAMTAILYVRRTGCQGTALPRSLGAPSPVHDRFQAGRAAKGWERLWQAGRWQDDALKGLDGEGQAREGALTKAPLGGAKGGPAPPDRGPRGTKRGVLTGGQGMPLGGAVDGAKRHDMTCVEAPLEARMIKRPRPTARGPQHLWGDTGAAYDAGRETGEAWGDTAHIQRRGAERPAKRARPGDRARRWVVARPPAWLHRFRRWRIRGETKVEHAVAGRPFAWAWITVRAAELFG